MHDNIVDLCWVVLRNLHDDEHSVKINTGIAYLYASKTINGVTIHLGYPGSTLNNGIYLNQRGSGISFFSANWIDLMPRQTVIEMKISEIDNDGAHDTFIGTMIHELSHYFFGFNHFGTIDFQINEINRTTTQFSTLRTSSNIQPYACNSSQPLGEWYAGYWRNNFGTNWGPWYKGDTYIDANHNACDFIGDDKDLYDVGDVITKWSNGASHKRGSTSSPTLVATNIGVEIKSFNPTYSSYTVEVRTSQPELLAPSKPQKISSSFSSASQTVTAWYNNPIHEPDLSGYHVYRQFYYINNDGTKHYFTETSASGLITQTTFADNVGTLPTIPAGKILYLRYRVLSNDNQGKFSVKAEGNPLAILPAVISINLSLNSAFYCLGDVAINFGVTLNLEPGTILKFISGKSLIVNGVLLANGNSIQPITFASVAGGTYNSWNSIELNGSGASGSQISYANINYGNEVRVISVPNFDISYCSFINNYISIYAYGSSGDIHDNNLTSTSVGHSIDIEGSSSINCYKNTITKTGTNQKSGVGILYGGGCSGMVHENDISYCDWGIGAIWGAYPIAFSYSASAVNNRIINCNIGINVYRDSYAQFGSQYVFTSSHNSIYRNSSYNALVGWSYPTYSCGLYAMYNWWGSNNPNTLLFYTGPNAYFYYQPYIMQDPWEYAQNVAYKNDVNVISQQNEQSYKSVSADSNSLFYGMMLRSKGDYKAAKDFFISYLEKYPENQAAYVELYNCYTKDIANDLIKYFTSLPKEASKDHKLFLSYLYLKQGSPAKAKDVNGEIISENPNTSLAAKANVNNLYIALYNENNIDYAISIFNSVSKSSETLTKAELSDIEYAIETYKSIHENSPSGSYSINKNAGNIIVEAPKAYSLLGNYPNPFNPTTTISYNLPRMSDVELKIYDILGNEVKSFFVPSQSAGTQNIVWSGTNNNNEYVSSGIYIYIFKAVSREGKNEVFEKSAKLLLMK